MDDEVARSAPSLVDEQKELTRSRIQRAAMEVVARDGFDATVEEIARVSGVSPRTIFRHYATQASLIVATVKDMFDACGQQPIEGLPEPSDDLVGWIDGLATTIHTRNAEIVGDAFWDLHAPSLAESETLAEIAILRRDLRVYGVRYLANLAWQRAGGTGEAPEDLVSTVALNFSAFATQALMIDYECSPTHIGALTADIVKLMLTSSLDQQRAQSSPAPRTEAARGPTGETELRLGIAEAMHHLMRAPPVGDSPE
jgi:AcrR family transcriptional regulator